MDECRYFNGCVKNALFKTTIIKNDMIEIFDQNVKKYKESGRKPIKKVLRGTHAVLASREKIEESTNKREKEKIFISEDILFTKFEYIQINLVKVNYAVEIAKTVNLIAQSGIPEKIRSDMQNKKTKK
ncbi:uncharacterized protein LOC111627372 [Centruroides sculpturatus]|uniref:uncharacterized protein LOC111627372 n=1 Tax=Centruroides sculpturatus TaxID=218467 RepID=UPI000C6D1FFA|nr:uncharacterized protein LOC111627372 [Centruroides sculpturatus]